MAALNGERLDDASLGDVRQQPQRSIQARFAAAIGAGDDRERVELQPYVAQGTVARDA